MNSEGQEAFHGARELGMIGSGTASVGVVRQKDGVPQMTVVRISLGRFDASRYAIVRKLLDDSQASLIPAIRALNGNLAYYVGIDQENNTMTNVSVWSSLDDAKRMASLPAMLALAKTFTETGVSFERPITNHETLWSISEAA
jgi:quinol monooxygenase YgiN